MPGRKFDHSSLIYRYGFNGKENDNVEKGEGNQQDYGMRIYDTKLGRFLSVDPLFRAFPWNSPYVFAENSVLENIDLDGLERYNYRLILDKDGRIVIGIQQHKVIKDRIQDFFNGEVHRVIDPESQLLFEFKFRNGTELSKFVVGKSLDYLREASTILFEKQLFFAVLWVAANDLQTELERVKPGLRRMATMSRSKAKNTDTNDLPINKSNSGHNAAEFQKLKSRYRFQEKNSIFSKDGSLKPEIIRLSEEIMNGTQLNNRNLKLKLTSDGSNNSDWNKMSYKIRQDT